MKIKKYSIYLIDFFFVIFMGILIATYHKPINYEQELYNIQQYEYKILDAQKEEVFKQGYKNPYYEINKIVQQLDRVGLKYNYRVDKHGSVEAAIINKYDFYATYYITKVDKKDYIFKAKQECENFIKDIKKYTNENYKIKKVNLFVYKETPKKELDNIIKNKKAQYEKAKVEAAARKKRQIASKIKKATSGDKKVYQDYAHKLVLEYGWTEADFDALVILWQKESGWNPYSKSKSGAYGIPQALPGSKMKSAGADWQTNYKTQIKWGLNYIKKRYGSPSKAYGHFKSKHWY